MKSTMSPGQENIQVDYKSTAVGSIRFLLANAVVFIGFSFLWARQYHMMGNTSDVIDTIVVPWAWIIGFFAASFVTLRKQTKNALLVSIVCTVFATTALWIFILIVIIPLYDPMF